MKVLITGGSGFIGSELAKVLAQRGYEVTIADLRETNIPETSYVFCDILDSYQVEEAVGNNDLVFHLAANPNPSLADKNPRWDLLINVNGTLNVAQSCRKRKARMIFSSTAAITYAPNSCYAISKRTAEMYILHKVVKNGLNASIVRFWNIYGPSQRIGFVIPDFFEKILDPSKEMLIGGDGSDLRDYVYISDAIEALQFVAEKGVSGITYEIGTGNLVTTYQLAELMEEVVKVFKPITTSKTRKDPSVLYLQDLDPIKKLGWNPKISLKEGLEIIGRNKW
jgi:nucleoside-diphosphate-sugar epimerase